MRDEEDHFRYRDYIHLNPIKMLKAGQGPAFPTSTAVRSIRNLPLHAGNGRLAYGLDR